MDLIYIPEVFAYGSFRNSHFQDYEQPWNKSPFDSGRSAQSKHSQLSHKYQRKATSVSKDNCHLCRESKRRSLATYIRNKARSDISHEIHEEEEEEEEQQQKGNEKERFEEKRTIYKNHDTVNAKPGLIKK